MKYRDLIKLIAADGWVVERVAGSHMQSQHPTKPGTVTVPAGGNLAKYIPAGNAQYGCHENKTTAFTILPKSPIFHDLRVPQGGMTNCHENLGVRSGAHLPLPTS